MQALRRLRTELRLDLAGCALQLVLHDGFDQGHAATTTAACPANPRNGAGAGAAITDALADLSVVYGVAVADNHSNLGLRLGALRRAGGAWERVNGP